MGIESERALFLLFLFPFFPPLGSRGQTLSKPPTAKGLSRDIAMQGGNALEATGVGEGAVGKLELDKVKPRKFFFVSQWPNFTRSLFLASRPSSADDLPRWRPLHSSRPRCCRHHPAAAAPAAATGPSLQQQGRRTLSAAAGGSHKGRDRAGHRRSLPPRRPLLRPRPPPPPTCAPPRRASSAMRASSSGTRRWYF